MITSKDLQEAIAYYSGKVDPQPNDAVYLAACYILQDHMAPEAKPEVTTYSFASEPPEEITYRDSGADIEVVGEYGDSDFLQAICGKNPADMWLIMDDLMDTLKSTNMRVYDRIMRDIG